MICIYYNIIISKYCHVKYNFLRCLKLFMILYMWGPIRISGQAPELTELLQQSFVSSWTLLIHTEHCMCLFRAGEFAPYGGNPDKHINK